MMREGLETWTKRVKPSGLILMIDDARLGLKWWHRC